MQRPYTHLGQVRVYECVALTQLARSLAGLRGAARDASPAGVCRLYGFDHVEDVLSRWGMPFA
jgi:hypothetical protein